MLFLFVLETLLLMVIVILVRALLRTTAFTWKQVPFFLGFLAGSTALLLAVGILDGRAVRGDARNYTPLLVLACGTFCAWGFALRATELGRMLRSSHSSRMSFSFGIAGLSILASAYLVLTALDHWWFFRGNDTGVADVRGMGVGDVPCVTVLFRLQGGEALYRWPNVGNAQSSLRRAVRAVAGVPERP